LVAEETQHEFEGWADAGPDSDSPGEPVRGGPDDAGSTPGHRASKPTGGLFLANVAATQAVFAGVVLASGWYRYVFSPVGETPSMQNSEVLVTGGAGFIGSRVANALVADNEVHVVDDGYLGTPANLADGVTYHEQSVLADDLPTDVDVVFHLAALSSYQMHEEDPQRGARVNVEGFVNVVEQARRDGCDTIVYASTSSIYGSCTEPSPEEMAVSVNTGYEASKMSRERYAEYFSNHYGLSLAGLRYFSVYEGYNGGETHKDGYANVIAQFADAIAAGRSPELYGDGEQTRDFTHIDDIVRGTVLAAERELDGVYNLGTGDRYSFNTLVDLLNEELGTDVEPAYVENPIPEAVYVHDTCADTAKMREATGWEPEVDLQEGLRRVCRPYR
jgi:UDP-glucose 4-epimerase